MSQTLQKEAVFMSRILHQRVVLIPGRTVYNAHGQEVGTEPGITAEFQNGRYATSDPEEIELLRRRMAAPDGPAIWEVDPLSLAPDATELLMSLVGADPATIAAVLAEERAGYERPSVIEACERALSQVSEPMPVKRGPGRPPKVRD